MKKITLICFSILTANLFGQQYVPFPTNAIWYQVEEFQSNAFDYTAYNASFTFDGDTTIANLQYRKLIENQGIETQYIGALREGQQKEIFFYSKSDSMERLLYKFGLSIGDSLKVKLNTPDGYIKILSIDSVLIGNSFRKRYLMNTQTIFEQDYWIEGIGSTKGLFYTQKGGEFENTSTLFCFEHNGTIEYRNPRATSSCTAATNELADLKIEVYPNPTSGIINFTLPRLQAMALSVRIFDIIGNMVAYKKVDPWDLSFNIRLENVSNGLYFYEFSTEKGRKAGKLLIQK